MIIYSILTADLDLDFTLKDACRIMIYYRSGLYPVGMNWNTRNKS